MNNKIHQQMLNCLGYDEDTLRYTCLNVTVTKNYLRMNRVVELKPGGVNINVDKNVDKSNLLEYTQLRTKYILLKNQRYSYTSSSRGSTRRFQKHSSPYVTFKN
mmetsp:Transcript_10008/g.20196  ORF Transcript_10008/g.20196 Transcript_10008/m.20196 type:complete len:104 (+) Transcript_10008:613-924(+)